jgi:hypothetical protein
VLESAKDRILRVDTPGQYVLPHVRYGTACLLIRNDMSCVSYSIEWRCASFFVSYFLIHLNHMVQDGPFAEKSLALQAGFFAWESIAKHDILL